ncbi:hypothetical protein Taro_009684, partial [Colocasia esculenta]|nr:hypothetical protein [Colocasia esculenta]
ASLARVQLSGPLSLCAVEAAGRRHHAPGTCINAHKVEDEEEDAELVALAGALRAAASLKLQFKHRSTASRAAQGIRKLTVAESAQRLTQTLHRQITVGRNWYSQSRFAAQKHRRRPRLRPPAPPGKLVMTVTSWASLGYGEFLADVFVGTPPRRFSLVLDTGSDLSWLQCLPCYNCFERRGGLYYPALSSSYRPLSCADIRCHLIHYPDQPVQPCRSTSQPCSYFYPYGDGGASSTGNLALEDLTLGPDVAASHLVEDVVFGCAYKGFFKGAAGLLGLGRGPFDISTSGKLVFGEDPALMALPGLNFTSFIAGAVDSYYYVRVKGIKVAGDLLDIPSETWELSPDGRGGAIVDSGTTLSHFSAPAVRAIRDAWEKKAKDYPVAAVQDLPELSPCRNISAFDRVSLPDFSILFADGAAWHFPPENFFIRPRKDEVLCLAVLADSPSALSMILGNYQ